MKETQVATFSQHNVEFLVPLARPKQGPCNPVSQTDKP